MVDGYDMGRECLTVGTPFFISNDGLAQRQTGREGEEQHQRGLNSATRMVKVKIQ